MASLAARRSQTQSGILVEDNRLNLMRSIYTYSVLAATFASVAAAQIVLDPSPARVLGHPVTSPVEQLLVTTVNPNFGNPGGLYSPQGIALDTTSSPPILYVADTANNRIRRLFVATNTLTKSDSIPNFSLNSVVNPLTKKLYVAVAKGTAATGGQVNDIVVYSTVDDTVVANIPGAPVAFLAVDTTDSRLAPLDKACFYDLANA